MPPFLQQDFPINNARLIPADIHWNDLNQPRSARYDDIYFSVHDGLAETQHVFLDGNDLPRRFAGMQRPTFIIGECGFGFGLNFLLTWDLFCRTAPPGSCLHFLSCEMHPVNRQDLERFLATLPATLRQAGTTLLSAWPPPSRGQHRLALDNARHRAVLDLLFDDTTAALARISVPGRQVDAWYLDGFAPARNPAIWTPALYERLAALSRPEATLASYSVAGKVRRQLQQAGFIVARQPGYGSKREMLVARLEDTTAPESLVRTDWTTPWPGQQRTVRRVAIIGAGLAGCATAHALAGRGLAVSVIDKHTAIASEASGNPRGIVHFKPGRQMHAAARFRLGAYQFATRHYQALARTHDFGWRRDGALQLAIDAAEQELVQALLDRGLYDEASVCKSDSAVSHGTVALAFPAAGSLCPPALCSAWLADPGIERLMGQEVVAMRNVGNAWHLELAGSGGSSQQAFDAVVFCTGQATPALSWLPSYPLQLNHGQTDTYTVPENLLPDSIRLHRGYVIPWHDGNQARVTLGGHVQPGPGRGDGMAESQASNLELADRFCPALVAAIRKQGLVPDSRQGTRIGTTDYLPLAGPVEDRQACAVQYAPYARNARQRIDKAPVYQPGLYINTAHGGNGLATTPLLGEYVASLICGDILPLPADQVAAVHPLRYLVRDLKRQRGG